MTWCFTKGGKGSWQTLLTQCYARAALHHWARTPESNYHLARLPRAIRFTAPKGHNVHDLVVAMRASDIGPSLRSLLGAKDYTYSPLQPRDLQGQSRGGRRRNRFALVLGTFAILAMLLVAIIRRFGRSREHASPMLYAQVAHIVFFTGRVAVREGAKQQPAVNRRPLTYGASTHPSSACLRTLTPLSRPPAS